MRYRTLQLAQRIIVAVSLVALVSIMLIVARLGGYGVPVLDQLIPHALVGAAFAKRVALISGHAGYDSGAVCGDDLSNPDLTEAAVIAAVTERVAQRLRRAGADVLILEEFDTRLAGLRAAVLLSLHADSCVDASGYKAASAPDSPLRTVEVRLNQCIDLHYPAVTGLAHHPNTITHDMTNYHAFRTIDSQTPAAIIELGFLGGDQDLLVNRPDQVAQGVAESLLCFLGTETEQDYADDES